MHSNLWADNGCLETKIFFCGKKEMKEVMNPSNEVKEDFIGAKVKIILASEWIMNF